MEWKEVRLGDVCDLIAGFAFKAKDFGEFPTKVIKIGDIKPPFVDYVGQVGVDISNYDINRLSKYTVKYGDYVLAMTGATIGKVGKYISENFSYINQRVLKFSPKQNVDADFINYIICSNIFAKYVVNFVDSESAQPNISAPTISKFAFQIPSEKDDQHRIASILSSLDRKIELNNKINTDLEEMAQAIFKNWFVDFEPFKNGKFVDSELGMIPEGWKVGSYSEMIESLISGDWGKETPQGNYTHEVACVRGCDFQDINNGVRGKTPQRYILEKNYQAKHLKDKDILVEISGGTATVSTGRTSLVTEELLKKYKHDIVCTNFCKVLRPLSQFSSYVYYSWKYKYDNDIMFGYENGTSGIKNFAIKDFIEKEPVLIPKEQDIVEFQKIIDNLQKQKQIKGTENTTLSTLRDTLLPRLMSGELEVPE